MDKSSKSSQHFNYEDEEPNRSKFSKFDFRDKFSGEGDQNLNEWLDIFEINCQKYNLTKNEKLL